MGGESKGTYPLPDDPSLAEVSQALQDTGHWGWVVDERWNLVFVTDELRLTFGAGELSEFAVGSHMFGPETAGASRKFRFGANSDEINRVTFAEVRGMVLNDTPGGHDELRETVDSSLRDLVDEASPVDPAALSFVSIGEALFGATNEVPVVMWRIRDPDGRLAGTALISKPAPGMHTLSDATSMGDLRHLKRMQQVGRAGRRPAAILFADLEASSPLSRRLSTASYFKLGRRLVVAADQCVIDAGGLVGRHVGDGVVAFFLAEISGSESAAARECIAAAHALRGAVADVAARSDLDPEDVVLRFGLHRGSNLYVGNISTGGRSEVTALGDEVNEAARIEACAGGGRALASKDLIERLEPEDAAALDLDPDALTYDQLGELKTATEKARRDAPSVAVCEV
ncbi:MAG: hypothetical protein IPK93_04930 [Solirubrobacterales bacterium]|nr:hypothetical protein [Solirubrobacterales bacterium]